MHHEGIAEAIFEAACARAVYYEPDIPLTESENATKALVLDFLSSLRTSSDEWDPLALKGLTNDLRSFSLLDYNTHSGTYSMHPLVQEWCRTIVPDVLTMRESAAWLLSLCVNWETDSANYALRRRLMPYLLALDSDHTQMVPDHALDLLQVYDEAGYTKEYEALATIALQASRDALGNEDPTTLQCMRDLAWAFQKQGMSNEAVAILTEVVEIRERVLGREHTDTLASIYVLAITYNDQGRHKEAEALFLEVIEVYKRVICAEHINTLKRIGMLAVTYLNQYRLPEAEGLYV